MDKPIYTITTIRMKEYIRNRCVGFYYDLNKAVAAVENNDGDIYECGYYPFCVIEDVREGIYNILRSEIWFEWNKEQNGYRKIKEKPKEFAQTVCFSIG